MILQLDLLDDSLKHFVIMANKGQFIMQDHPNDAPLLNKPIQHYKQMMVIFANGQATGK